MRLEAQPGIPEGNPLSDLLGHLKKHLGESLDTPSDTPVASEAPFGAVNDDYISVDHLISLAYQWRVSRRYLDRFKGKGERKDAAIIEERRRAWNLMKALGELRGELEDAP